MEILGYVASIVIGLSLGLIGGGGSILTVPVLVYLMAVEPVMATAYSLFVVGTTSLVGVFPKFKQGLVDVRTAVVFGIPSIVAVYLVRGFVVPAMPDVIFTLAGFEVSKSLLMMMLFAVLMVVASFSMIRNKKSAPTPSTSQEGPTGSAANKLAPSPSQEGSLVAERKFNYPLILVEGLLVGGLTGLVGAGGGFLIIPALVVLSKLPMKQAVGTSLLIIAAKSLIGFIGDLQHTAIEWPLLLGVTAAAVVGIFIGNALTHKVDGNKLKVGFGWFVLVMGVFIIAKELFFKGA